MKHLLLFILLCVASVAAVAADAQDWSFFSAQQSQTARWVIGQGTAKVVISGHKINIEIHETVTDIVSGKPMRMVDPTASISGTISRSGRISATHIIHHSDSDPIPLTGKMYRSDASQSIVFYDGHQIYGFVRKIP